MKCKNCGAELNNGKCEYCGSVFEDIQAKSAPLPIPNEMWIIETKDGDVFLDDAQDVTIYNDCGGDYVKLCTNKEIKSEPLRLKQYDYNTGEHCVRISSLEHNRKTGMMRVNVGYCI